VLDVGRWLRPKRIGLILAVVLAIFVAAELFVRLIGLTDFPIYNRAPGVGYYLKPGQHGAFLNRNRWFVNEQGFENREPFAPSERSCLLVGDSVVYGGNPVDYYDRVGALAAKDWGRGPIWVASAGGWNLLNELSFLNRRRQQIKSIDHVVFIFNNGDFGKRALWTGELAFPTNRPILATPYLFSRYVLPHPAELPPISRTATAGGDAEWRKQLDDFLEFYPGSTTIILYPDKDDFRDRRAWLRHTAGIRRFAAQHSNEVTLVDIAELESWNLSMYRDGVHPTLAGNKALAARVADACGNSGD
jgi:hypothetical protein